MIITLDNPIKLEKENVTYHHVDIVIRHSHGGINYATYKQEQSGYFLHFSPCNYREEHGYSVKEYGHLFNDYAFKIRIASGYRFSKKKLEKLQEIFNKNKENILLYYTNGNKMKLLFLLENIYNEYLKD